MTMRKRLSMFAAGLLLAATVAWGQQSAPAAGTPAAKTFDVATVRVSAPLDMQKLQADMQAGKMPNFGAHLDGLRAEYNRMTLQQLIIYAYKVKPYQVIGPDWLNTEHYDVVARLPEGSTKDDAPEMLKALLIDRFKLQAHMETKDLAVSALVVGKDGPKLKDSPENPPIDESAPLKPGQMKQDMPDGPARITPSFDGKIGTTIDMGERGVFVQKIDTQSQTVSIDGKGVAMPGFIDLLNLIMTQMGGGSGAKLTVDQTGLKGHYEVSLQLSLADLIAAARRNNPDIPAPPPPPGGGGPGGMGGGGAADASDPGGGGSSVSSSLDKLGLKLTSSHAPIQQLIIDHAEKTPSEN